VAPVDALTTCLRDAKQMVEMSSKAEDTGVRKELEQLEIEESKYLDVLDIQSGSSKKLAELEKNRAEVANQLRMIELFKQRLNKVSGTSVLISTDKMMADELNKIIDEGFSKAFDRKNAEDWDLPKLESEIEGLKSIAPHTARKNLAVIREKRGKLAESWDSFNRQWQASKDRFKQNRCEPRLKLEDKWQKEFDPLKYESSPVDCVRVNDRASPSLQVWKKANGVLEEFEKGDYFTLRRANEIVRDPKVLEQENEKVRKLRLAIFASKQFVVISQEGSEFLAVPNEFSLLLGKALEKHPFIFGIAALSLIRYRTNLKIESEQLDKMKNLAEQLRGQSENERAAILARVEEKHRRLKRQKEDAKQGYLKFFVGNNLKECVDDSVSFSGNSDEPVEKQSDSLPLSNSPEPANNPKNRLGEKANAIN